MIRKYIDSCSPLVFAALVFAARCGSASTRDEHSDSRRQSRRLVVNPFYVGRRRNVP